MGGRFTASFTVLRLLFSLKLSFAEAKKWTAPYNKIVRELSDMLKDLVSVIQQSTSQPKENGLYIREQSDRGK